MRNLLGLTLVCASLMSCVDMSSSGSNNAVDTASTDTEATATVANSPNSAAIAGTYEATIPCADCPGIKTTIVINNDETFRITSEYLERDSKFEDNGKLMWHDNGTVLHLKGKDTDLKLKVGEDQLYHLDEDGQTIEGDLAENYIYKKKA